MTDLDAAIRERLALDDDRYYGSYYFQYDCEMIQGAMFAVLDLHAPGDEEPGMGRLCTACANPASGHFVFDPCPTKRAIAEALGINTDPA